MNKISTVLSSVGNFSDTTKNQYAAMLSLANEVLRQVHDMIGFVQGEKSKVEKQAIRIAKAKEDISEKTLTYSIEKENAYSDYQYYRDKHYYSDDDDDFYKEMADDAYSVYSAASEKYSYASAVEHAINEKSDEIERLKSAISSVESALERNAFEIKKYITLFEDEASYNMQSLRSLIASIQMYVNSHEIFSTYSIERASEGTASSYISVGSSKRSSSSTSDKEPVKVKYRLRAQSIEQYLTRYGQEKPIYRKFNVYAPPVKDMILQATLRMGPAFQQFLLKQLEGVIFLNAQHGFTYSATNKNGMMIRIIGVNLTDPAFSRNLLKHVAHHIYLTHFTAEKVTLDNLVAREAENNARNANWHIQNITQEITSSTLKMTRRKNVNVPSKGSKFFASCFKAHIEGNHEFLSTVKENYKESYKVFSDMMKKMPN